MYLLRLSRRGETRALKDTLRPAHAEERQRSQPDVGARAGVRCYFSLGKAVVRAELKEIPNPC